jgi:hypothetical protein
MPADTGPLAPLAGAVKEYKTRSYVACLESPELQDMTVLAPGISAVPWNKIAAAAA